MVLIETLLFIFGPNQSFVFEVSNVRDLRGVKQGQIELRGITCGSTAFLGGGIPPLQPASVILAVAVVTVVVGCVVFFADATNYLRKWELGPQWTLRPILNV